MDDIRNSSNNFRAPLKLEDSLLDNHTSTKPEKPLGNREAVKKYREKKKAQNAYLEEEVKKLRVMNRGLIRKLQLQDALQAEAVRLRSLLNNLKTEIGKELGVSYCSKRNCNDISYCCVSRD